jgi:hypothetical protein
MSYIYACLFSNGYVKVGRSINPDVRIAQHKERVSCFGITLDKQKITFCNINDSVFCERVLIDRCVDRSVSRNKREWFVGLDYDEVCLWLDEVSLLDKVQEEVAVPVEKFEWHYQKTEPRYFITWPNGYKIDTHVWNDRLPHLPHWPDSAVMRWDLRDDWNYLWPELHNHPCAIYFAPKHPYRVGDKSFRSWVESWPVGFCDKDYIKNMPDSAKEIVYEVWPSFIQTKKKPLCQRQGIGNKKPAVAGLIRFVSYAAF